MSSKRSVVKGAVIESLALCSLDECFERIFFQRRKGSLVYKRTRGELAQEMEICFDLSPRYEPSAIAHLLPQVRLTCEEVAPAIAAMTNKLPSAHAFAGRVGGMILKEQINNLAPVGQRSRYWYLYSLDPSGECISEMKSYIEAWTVPFFEEYTDLEAIVMGYERHDGRLPNNDRFYVYVAACYMLLGLPKRALSVLECRLGEPGRRKAYSQAFEYVASFAEPAS